MRKLQLVVLVLGILLIAVYIGKQNRQQPIAQNPVAPIEIPPEPEPKPEPPKEYTLEGAVQSISKDRLKKSLEYLASQELEGRMSGKRGNVVAAEYIKKEFEKFGLQTMYHKFNIQRMNAGPKNETGDDFTQNIYAWIEGTDPALKNEIVVIGAHMDHIGYGPSMSRSRRIAIHPGADDNASGTVALIEIAHAFSLLKGQVKRTVVFQAYSAEEMGLIGSRYYCNNPTFPKEGPSIQKHIFMLNMDMVGYLNKGQMTAAFYEGDSSVDIGRIIEELNGKYNFARKITSRGSGGSDHASFYNKRVPIAFLHTGSHPHYHTPDDTPDKINYDGIEVIARYGFELAWKVVQGEDRPRFNYAGFRPLPYVHDHGHPDVPFIHSYHRHTGEHEHHDHDHEH